MARAGSEPSESILRELARLTAPLLVWAAHFTILYGTNTLACLGDGSAAGRIVITVATVVALLLVGLAARRFGGRRGAIGGRMVKALALLSAFAICGAALAFAFIESCAGAR